MDVLPEWYQTELGVWHLVIPSRRPGASMRPGIRTHCGKFYLSWHEGPVRKLGMNSGGRACVKCITCAMTLSGTTTWLPDEMPES